MLSSAAAHEERRIFRQFAQLQASRMLRHRHDLVRDVDAEVVLSPGRWDAAVQVPATKCVIAARSAISSAPPVGPRGVARRTILAVEHEQRMAH